MADNLPEKPPGSSEILFYQTAWLSREATVKQRLTVQHEGNREVQRRIAWMVLLAGAMAVAGCPPKPVRRAGKLGSGYLSGEMVLADHGVVFYGQDVLAHPGERVRLTARLRKPRSFAPVGGVTVTFHAHGDPAEPIGSAKTDRRGVAALDWAPPGEGQWRLTARPAERVWHVRHDIRKATAGLLVLVVRPRRPFVVVDLDHTLVEGSFYEVLTDEAPDAMPKSSEVLRKIAGRYGIIYLTHRPNVLTRKSKRWLSDEEFPLAPLITCRLRESLGDSGEAKGKRLAVLKARFPNTNIGVGDRISDVRAYLSAGMTAYLIPHCKETARDMRKMAKQIRSLPSKHRVQVVGDWRQIESGILRGRRFDPDAFAADLERRAKDEDED